MSPLKWGLSLGVLSVLALGVAVIGAVLLPEQGPSDAVVCAQPLAGLQDLAETVADIEPVLGIAHDAGERVAKVEEAIQCGAAIVEIDVRTVDEVLVLAHPPPPDTAAPTLAEVWTAASAAPAIELDLKQPSPSLVAALGTFLTDVQHAESARILVSTKDAATLNAIAAQWPDVQRFLSVETDYDLAALQADPALLARLDGVNLAEDLAEAATVAWLQELGLLVFVWTVNDPWRMRAVAALGVDGIKSDALALVHVLGGQDDVSTRLDRRARRAERRARKDS